MQGRLIQSWSFARFREQVGKRRFALVGVGRGAVRLDSGLVAWFDHRWPDEFGVGTLDLTRPPPRFVEDHFRSAAGTLRLGPNGPISGVYLFEWSAVIGLHTGSVGTPPIDDAIDQFVRPRVRAGDPASVVGMARYLSELVERRLGGASAKAESPWTEAPKEERRVAPPPSLPQPDADHALFGLVPPVTLRDLTVAYREQIKLNHPDKVAHLSPALQKFAEMQTIALMQAYERIKSGLS